MSDENAIKTSNSFIIWNDENKNIKILIDGANETIWLNQKQISELFEVDRSVIAKHILNIYDTLELDKKTTCAKFAQVRSDGNFIR